MPATPFTLHVLRITYYVLRITLFLLLASFTAPAAESLVLELRNGDRVTGALVSESPDEIVLSNAWSKAILISKPGVLKRSPALAAAPTNAMPILAPATNAAVSRWTNWHGDLQAGMNLHKGEQDSELFYVRLKLAYAKRRLHNSTDLSVEYGKTDGVASAQRVDGSWKTEYDLRPRVYVYNYFDGTSDRVRQIDLRYQDGPGVGYRLLTRTNLTLALEAGANYQAEYHADHTTKDGFTMRLAESLNWRLGPRFVLEQKLDYYPELQTFDQFRLRAEATIKYLLTGRLSLNLTALDQYDRTPAQGVQRNDLQMRSSIGLTF
jgi:putative salt-induced outer membrane protein YdiY